MKERILGLIIGFGFIGIWIISYIAILLPINVILSHFGIGTIASFIIAFLYLTFFSKSAFLIEILSIAGGYFAYKEWPISFFIFYCSIFVLITLINYWPLILKKKSED